MNNKITLIADSGSTKTDWCFVAQGKVLKRIVTEGTNPFFQTDEEIALVVEKQLQPHLIDMKIEQLYFYGAGCAFPKQIERLRYTFAPLFHCPIEVGSDLLAAARALCGNQPGIACIMGTGSNSCYYDGEQIVDNVSPLGYVLGDEGSGAVLGKLLVGDCLKGELTPELKESFLQRFQLTPAEILNRVYKQPFPNRFLASLSPFLLEHIDEPCIHRLVLESFKSFFQRNINAYNRPDLPVHFVGSIAYYYQSILAKAAKQTGFTLGNIYKSPMEGVVAFHTNR